LKTRLSVAGFAKQPMPVTFLFIIVKPPGLDNLQLCPLLRNTGIVEIFSGFFNRVE
jgi:hypothetical protein